MIKSGIITNSSPPTASDTTGFATLYLTSAYDGTLTIETGKLIESRTRILGTADWLEVDYSYDSYGRTNATSGNNHLDLSTGSETVFTTYDFADNPLTTERTSPVPPERSKRTAASAKPSGRSGAGSAWDTTFSTTFSTG